MAFRLYVNPWGATLPTMRLPLTASEAFTEGEVVVFSSGKLTAAAATSTNIVGIMAETKTASASGTTYGLVYPAYPGVQFEADYTGTHSASNIGTQSLDLSDENTIQIDDVTGGAFTLLSANTTDTTCVVTVADSYWAK